MGRKRFKIGIWLCAIVALLTVLLWYPDKEYHMNLQMKDDTVLHNISVPIIDDDTSQAVGGRNIDENKTGLWLMMIDSSENNDGQRTLLTLFTTWVYNPSKDKIHNATVINWSKLKSIVNVVVFTNDSRIASKCKQNDWHVLPIIHTAAGGVPILKYMYMSAMDTFSSQFYAYSNSDILFTDALIVTLLSLANTGMDMNHPLLIVGTRTNVKNVTESEAKSYPALRRAADRGKLFGIGAIDYFITTQAFPWTQLEDVVIGRPGYDNWVVLFSRRKKLTILDTTKTILAVHQTDIYGNSEGHTHEHSEYNIDLLKSQNNGVFLFNKGFTDCIGLYSVYKDSMFYVMQRTHFRESCQL